MALRRKVSSCKACAFWHSLDMATTGVENDGGECRRRAPSPAAQPEDDYTSPYAAWPITFAEEWCGEWERKARSGKH